MFSFPTCPLNTFYGWLIQMRIQKRGPHTLCVRHILKKLGPLSCWFAWFCYLDAIGWIPLPFVSCNWSLDWRAEYIQVPYFGHEYISGGAESFLTCGTGGTGCLGSHFLVMWRIRLTVAASPLVFVLFRRVSGLPSMCDLAVIDDHCPCPLFG